MAYIQCGPADHVTVMPGGDVIVVCHDRDNIPSWVTDKFNELLSEQEGNA